MHGKRLHWSAARTVAIWSTVSLPWHVFHHTVALQCRVHACGCMHAKEHALNERACVLAMHAGAPTSGGKSLVAEVLMLRKLLATRNMRYGRFKGHEVRAQAHLITSKSWGFTALWRYDTGCCCVPILGNTGGSCSAWRTCWGARALLLTYMQEWKHALFILPYISVVAEKAGHLADVLSCTGARCRGYHGRAERSTPLQPGCACAPGAVTALGSRWAVTRSMVLSGPLRMLSSAAACPLSRSEEVAICTIEKANVAINRLVQEGRLGAAA